MLVRFFGVSLLILCCVSCTNRPILTDHSIPADTFAAADLNLFTPHFRAYVLLNELQEEVGAFVNLLKANEVDDVLAISELWLQGTEWRARGYTAYALPPRDHWPAMIKTLQFLKAELIPVIGPVKVMSGYRSTAYNKVAGGVDLSRHLTFSALDLKPQKKLPRKRLQSVLKNIWDKRGGHWDLGLGLYPGLRFHVDTGGYRIW